MTVGGFLDAALGRLWWDALPFWEILRYPEDPSRVLNGVIATGAASLVVFGALAAVWVLTRRHWWRPLWSDWLTSVDHKKIGIMYVALALVMLARGIVEATFMRAHQATALGGGFLTPEHFGQFFTTHGTIMIFFVAMPFLTGLINYVMPLQIGARDVSFPVLNSVSLGLTAAGAALVMVSLVLMPFSTGGWSGYPPFTEASFNPGAGPDYWIWAVTLSSLGSTMTGINFAVTIYKERAEGMRFFRMPLFCWTALCTAILMIFAMPPLTVATALLALDRYADFHFFTNDLGGNMMNYANLFWLFGHPGGLHPDPARLRDLFRGLHDVLRQDALRLQVARRGDDVHRGAVLHRLGAPLLHHGTVGRAERRLRHRDDADRHPDGREDLRLDADDVPRARCG